MSGYTSALRAVRSGAYAADRRGGSVRAWAGALWARLALMRRAAETRRELGGLHPRLLADIGVSRAEASREAERWPWDLETGRDFDGGGTGAHR
jgi:uncharacterized protein YjiS (DUF1127 family)